LRFVSALCLVSSSLFGADSEFLHWDLKKAHSIALSGRFSSTVGSRGGRRGLHTERSVNYKLRATWFTPDVIRADARLAQLANHYSDEDTLQMVSAAESAADTIFLIEIDPREGSGIIPSTWTAILSPGAPNSQSVRNSKGLSKPAFQELTALKGGTRRDYDYDVFWLAFSLRATDGSPLFLPDDHDAELTVRIHDQLGKVRLPIPASYKAFIVKDSIPK
jgi:hypothetical protein